MEQTKEELQPYPLPPAPHITSHALTSVVFQIFSQTTVSLPCAHPFTSRAFTCKHGKDYLKLSNNPLKARLQAAF